MKNTDKLMTYCALGILFSLSMTYLGGIINNKAISKMGAMGTIALPGAIAVSLMGSKKQHD